MVNQITSYKLRKILVNVGFCGGPMPTPSNCWHYSLLNITVVSFMVKVNSSQKESLDISRKYFSLLNRFLTSKSIVPCNRIFVKSSTASKLAIIRLESRFWSFVEKKKRYQILYCSLVNYSTRGTKNLASLLEWVPIADKIGWKDGILSVASLWILANLYKIPGLEPTGWKVL